MEPKFLQHFGMRQCYSESVLEIEIVQSESQNSIIYSEERHCQSGTLFSAQNANLYTDCKLGI